MLSAVDPETQASFILRRFFLVHLLAFRNSRQAYHSKEPSKKVVKGGQLAKRASSKALIDIMDTLYPDINELEYKKKYASLKTQLTNARNWHALQKRFGVGVLALVPPILDHGVRAHQ